MNTGPSALEEAPDVDMETLQQIYAMEHGGFDDQIGTQIGVDDYKAIPPCLMCFPMKQPDSRENKLFIKVLSTNTKYIYISS